MDRVIFLGCFLLLALGFFVGLGIDPSVGLSQSVRGGLELLSFAGTAITAVVALAALTSWRAQFRHSEKWKAVKNFQDALDGGEAAYNYLLGAFSMNAQNKSAPWHERRLDFTSEFQEKQRAWFAQCSAVNKAWSQLALLFDAREIVNLDAHRTIQGEVDEAIQVVLQDYFQVETSDMVIMYNFVSSCSARARSVTHELFSQAAAIQGILAR